jgi:hypothetical protein
VAETSSGRLHRFGRSLSKGSIPTYLCPFSILRQVPGRQVGKAVASPRGPVYQRNSPGRLRGGALGLTTEKRDTVKRIAIALIAPATTVFGGTLPPGENYVFPQVTLPLVTQITEIRVSPSTNEIAQEQLKDLEKQRVFGIVPNFYVSYISEAAPLTSKQKFQLALKATTDPVSLASVSVIAGVKQATDRFSGYGQGAQGYAKRYGASCSTC